MALDRAVRRARDRADRPPCERRRRDLRPDRGDVRGATHGEPSAEQARFSLRLPDDLKVAHRRRADCRGRLHQHLDRPRTLSRVGRGAAPLHRATAGCPASAAPDQGATRADLRPPPARPESSSTTRSTSSTSSPTAPGPQRSNSSRTATTATTLVGETTVTCTEAGGVLRRHGHAARPSGLCPRRRSGLGVSITAPERCRRRGLDGRLRAVTLLARTRRRRRHQAARHRSATSTSRLPALTSLPRPCRAPLRVKTTSRRRHSGPRRWAAQGPDRQRRRRGSRRSTTTRRSRSSPVTSRSRTAKRSLDVTSVSGDVDGHRRHAGASIKSTSGDVTVRRGVVRRGARRNGERRRGRRHPAGTRVSRRRTVDVRRPQRGDRPRRRARRLAPAGPIVRDHRPLGERRRRDPPARSRAPDDGSGPGTFQPSDAAISLHVGHTGYLVGVASGHPRLAAERHDGRGVHHALRPPSCPSRRTCRRRRGSPRARCGCTARGRRPR